MFKLFFIFLFISQQIFALNCHPIVDKAKPQYLIAYGSFMHEKSKRITSRKVGITYPIIINNFERGWFARTTSSYRLTTFLGAIPHPGSHFNGGIFHILKSEEISKYDKREENSCRWKINLNDLQMQGIQLPENAEVWMYIVKDELMLTATKKFPLEQTYIDTFISGCFELQDKFNLKNFAKECVLSTTRWPRFIINERLTPLRAPVSTKAAKRVDKLLLKFSED